MAESAERLEKRHLVSPVLVTMDEAYELAGGHGKYQLLVAVCSTITIISSMLYLFSIPMFLKFPKTSECTTDNGAEIPICNVTMTECYNSSLLYRYENLRFNFVSEYDLICDDVKATLIASVFSIGACFGCLLFSALSDAIGRLPVLFIGEAGMIAGTCYLVFFSSYQVCIWATIATGFFALACGPPSFSFAYDSMHAKYIPLYSTYINAVFAVGEILVALVMWSQITWRTMCGLILCWHSMFFIMFFVLYESPRFLITKGRAEEAGRALEYIAQLNSASLPKPIHIKDVAGPAGSSESTLKILLSPRMLCYLLVCSSLFLASGFVYFGISMSVQRLKGNLYVNVIINGVAEMVAVVLSGVAVKRYGNKGAVVGSLMITCVAVALQNTFDWNVVISSCCLYVAKFGISAAFNIAYICSGELFPTSVKGTALGIGVLCGRVGGLVAPMVSLNPTLQATLSVTLCVLGMFMSMFLSPGQELKEESGPGKRDEVADFKITR